LILGVLWSVGVTTRTVGSVGIVFGVATFGFAAFAFAFADFDFGLAAFDFVAFAITNAPVCDGPVYSLDGHYISHCME
jgi:hypothetical protein